LHGRHLIEAASNLVALGIPKHLDWTTDAGLRYLKDLTRLASPPGIDLGGPGARGV